MKTTKSSKHTKSSNSSVLANPLNRPNLQSSNVSIAPNGEVFLLPKPEDYAKEFKRLQKLVAKNRKEGREVVVVMGLGFVGAVMAGIVADAVQKKDPHGPPPALRATSTSGGQKESSPPLEGVGGGHSSLVARRSSLSTSSLIAVFP